MRLEGWHVVVFLAMLVIAVIVVAVVMVIVLWKGLRARRKDDGDVPGLPPN
jgi:heme/copper-type cytochrome/quinol oxidase subunit 2